MNFTAKPYADNLSSATYPVLVVPAFEDRGLPSDFKELDKSWRVLLANTIKSEVLTGEGEIFIVTSPVKKGIRRIAFVGMGGRDECDLETVRRAAGTAANALRKRDVGRICFLVEAFTPIDGDLEVTSRALLEGARLGSYFFDRFKSEKDTHVLTRVELHFPKGTKTKKFVPMLDEILTLTTSTILARDWDNTPSNFATPTHIARLANDIAKEANLSVKVLEEKECEKLGMGAFLGVAKGSHQPAKFILLDYKPRRYSKTICMVGKAITFDTGGISLKPGKDMHTMKVDMGGGMAVIATMRAIGLMKPQSARVLGIIPASENMPGGSAMKPGDIIRSQSGRSIEVLNTDAEGRLILADGLEYALRQYQPDAVIDVATLTGACVIALGEDVAGFWTDHENLATLMNDASDVTGEKVWQMPLVKEYDEHLKSICADIQNIGKREGGAITAALFLRSFVGETPWLHLDIAGPCWTNENKPYIPKGSTGYGPRLLYNFVKGWIESED